MLFLHSELHFLFSRDRKRKKFVGEQETPRKKRIKTESGHWIQASFKSNAYKEWKEKHKIDTPFNGQQEESGGVQRSRQPVRYRHNSKKGEQEGGMVGDLRPKAAIMKKRQRREGIEHRKKQKEKKQVKSKSQTKKTGKFKFPMKKGKNKTRHNNKINN